MCIDYFLGILSDQFSASAAPRVRLLPATVLQNLLQPLEGLASNTGAQSTGSLMHTTDVHAQDDPRLSCVI